MPCFSPLRAFYSREIGSSGKRGITFDRGASFSGSPLRLPCGQCVGCRLERSRQWAIRCLHENKMHAGNSCFVTLTFHPDHLPDDGSLNKKTLSAFCKRLHNRLLKTRGVGIRYYGCGEYGDENGRPHYHLLIFGWRPEDGRLYSKNHRGEELYSSKYLEEVWPFGMCLFGEVTFDSAAYVARYVMKKITGDKAALYYEAVSSDGEIYSMVPEFTVMSRRPGIGYAYFEKYGREAYDHDSVVVNGREVRPPKFYDSKMEALDASIMDALKLKRRRAAVKHRKDNTVDRRRVREVVALRRLQLLKRTVE